MLVYSGYVLLVVLTAWSSGIKRAFLFMYPGLFVEFTIYMNKIPAGLVTNRVIF